jgi:hypothetical protein
MRDPRRIFADLLKLAADAKRSEKSVPPEDAYDGEHLKRWLKLKAEMEEHLRWWPS